MNDVQIRIREIQETGWTLAELACELGVTLNAVEKWKAGDRRPANYWVVLTTLDRLAKGERLSREVGFPLQPCRRCPFRADPLRQQSLKSRSRMRRDADSTFRSPCVVAEKEKAGSAQTDDHGSKAGVTRGEGPGVQRKCRILSDVGKEEHAEVSHAGTSAGLASEFPTTAGPPQPDMLNGLKISPFSEDHGKINIFRVSPVFSNLDDEDVAEFSGLTLERRLRGGQFLFFEGDPVEYCYVVVSGMVKVLKHSLSGRDFITAIYGPGEMLGFIPILAGKPYAGSCQALTDTKVLQTRSGEFVSFLLRHPHFSVKIMGQMLNVACQRFLDSKVLLSNLASERADCRLAYALLTLCSEFGPTLPLTHRDIAEMAGTTTETATRFVSYLKRTRVVSSSRGKITVLQQDKLRLLAQIPLPI